MKSGELADHLIRGPVLTNVLGDWKWVWPPGTTAADKRRWFEEAKHA